MRIKIGWPKSRNQWVALALGAAVVGGSLVPLAKGVLSLAWNQADGVITYIGEKPGFRTIGVDVKYRYEVGGRTYTGDRYRFQFILTRDRMQSRDVQLIVGRYPVGERVQVAVNPRDPSESVLTAGPDLEGLLPLAAGMFLLLAALGEVQKAEPPLTQPVLAKPAGPRYRTAKVLAAIGAAVLLLGAHDVYQGVSSQGWPTADGRILFSHARTASQYETLLWYEYHVAGKRYLAGKYRSGGNSTVFRKELMAAAQRYPVGQAVKVYYNPSSPEEALLEPGAWYGNFVLVGIGAVVLGAAWLAKKYAEIMASRPRR